ncbi:carbohydrate ABC transporter permease [Thermoanaerobacterium sp. RBIITD]|uniref:carbohydrate ABC transporter permease n=1 Tax=Thermoanaerobacterium sp. RBIITD TaxID=1550240 RepID=UPI000BC05ACB|nr:carbohydrate ABC transporter permease [Thermoanaerobacterium sp. RBIITD]SNX53424.1 oligogalacturonide transport system permease protein [Thermoanaerobacterium sp. RBIITD]
MRSKINHHKNGYMLKILTYIFLIIFGIFMIYPLLWIVAASFKPNEDIFKSLSLIPSHLVADSYINGWKGTGQYGFGKFILNTFIMVIPTVIFTVISSTVVAYGFARFNFPLKKILFALMISTLMLPGSVIIIPRYILFNGFGWLNSYKPFIIPALFASTPFFVFMMVQFLRGLPKELEESAIIDGCNSFQTLINIIAPLCKPAIISMAIFQFIWTWNDFLNTLIYINGVEKYTVSLGLRMSIDGTSVINWNQIMAMTVISMLPCIIIFFSAQKYFVEGIATTGLKS